MGGVVRARNIGIDMARGEYILPLDSDDIILPTYIEKAVHVLEKNNNAGIVFCDAEYFGNQTGVWNLPKYDLKNMLHGNCIFVSALFRKRDWKAVGGFKEEFVDSTEDYEFWLSLIEKGCSVYKINEILFRYRQRNGQRSEKAKDSKKIIIAEHEKLFYDNLHLLDRGDLKKYIEIKYNKEDKIFVKAKFILAYCLFKLHLNCVWLLK